MRMHYVTAFPNRSNIKEYTVKKNGVEFDLNNALVTKIEVISGSYSIDSDGDYVSYSGSSLSVEFGALSIPAGQSASVKIIAYTALDTKGKVIISEGLEEGIIVTMRNI